MNEPDPMFPHPRVHLTMDIDLTRGEDPAEQLRQQSAGIPAGATVNVHLPSGWPAPGLERAIAGHLFLVAAEINLHAPAGFKGATWFTANVQQHVRQMREDHARTLAQRPAGTG